VRIVATSDCHGRYREAVLPEGDVLVLAGDMLPRGGYEPADLHDLEDWLDGVAFRDVILIAGNHDWLFERDKTIRPRNAIYLEDSGVELDGLEFYGSPWQPAFCNWAFNLPRNGPELGAAWDRIPPGTDVLITHGPPHGVLDRPFGTRPPVGCELLRERVKAIRPKAHIFGHIHGDHGKRHEGGTWFVNACLCDEDYDPVQPPLVIDV
jgi:Icc-related predicted phosphoesterase